MEAQEISDRMAISAVLDDYARGVDARDWDLVAACFASDATLDYTATMGPRGTASEVVDWIAASVATFPMSQHHITNRHIQLDGDDATCFAELLAVMGMAGPSEDGEPGKLTIMWTGGAYDDRFVRTPDGWKIGSRIFQKAWLAMGPEATGPMGPQG